VTDSSILVLSFKLIFIRPDTWYWSISFGDMGEGKADPNGLPYQVTGTLNGLPPWPGIICFDIKERAG